MAESSAADDGGSQRAFKPVLLDSLLDIGFWRRGFS